MCRSIARRRMKRARTRAGSIAEAVVRDAIGNHVGFVDAFFYVKSDLYYVADITAMRDLHDDALHQQDVALRDRSHHSLRT